MSNSIDLTSWFTDSSEEKAEKNKKKSTHLPQFLEQKLGVTKTMNCGLKATVIAYRSYTDIDVRFENDVIVTNKSWQHFCDGKIKCPRNVLALQKK